MRLTIIPGSNLVAIDDRHLNCIDCSAMDPTIHAVQWNGTKGHVEYKTDYNGDRLPNRTIEDLSEFQSLIDAFQAEAAKPPPPQSVARDLEREARLARIQRFVDDDDHKSVADALRNAATPAQLKAYIDANVTDLASAKVFIKKLALVVALLV